MSLKATEVFVPGSYPQHTYVRREGERLESSLRDALETPGQLVSLSGPSKSGKTVLVEKVVGRDLLISISGASLRSVDDVWNRALDWMDLPDGATQHSSTGSTIGGEIAGTGEASIPLVAKAELSANAKAERSIESGRSESRKRRGLQQVVDEVAGSDFVLLVDDFHYMPRELQNEVAKSLKEAIRLGVKVVTAAVAHRGDDIVRANPELRGRVRAIDLKYWATSELQRIAEYGFQALNVGLDSETVTTFALESAGSPQLMQLMCLQSCFVLGWRERVETTLIPKLGTVSQADLRRILEQTSKLSHP